MLRRIRSWPTDGRVSDNTLDRLRSLNEFTRTTGRIGGGHSYSFVNDVVQGKTIRLLADKWKWILHKTK